MLMLVLMLQERHLSKSREDRRRGRVEVVHVREGRLVVLRFVVARHRTGRSRVLRRVKAVITVRVEVKRVRPQVTGVGDGSRGRGGVMTVETSGLQGELMLLLEGCKLSGQAVMVEVVRVPHPSTTASTATTSTSAHVREII